MESASGFGLAVSRAARRSISASEWRVLTVVPRNEKSGPCSPKDVADALASSFQKMRGSLLARSSTWTAGANRITRERESIECPSPASDLFRKKAARGSCLRRVAAGLA
jgi:hypothetical protein